MPVNKDNCLPFKDTWAAPGSQLHAALEAGELKKAIKIYEECEATRIKLEGYTLGAVLKNPAAVVNRNACI